MHDLNGFVRLDAPFAQLPIRAKSERTAANSGQPAKKAKVNHHFGRNNHHVIAFNSAWIWAASRRAGRPRFDGYYIV